MKLLFYSHKHDDRNFVCGYSNLISVKSFFLIYVHKNNVHYFQILEYIISASLSSLWDKIFHQTSVCSHMGMYTTYTEVYV